MPRQISEERTRKEMIDPQLEQAGWYLRDHSKVKIEIPVDGYDAEPWNGVSDYCLYRENGEVPKQQIKPHNIQHNYNADQIRFLRAVQSVFLQKCHLETADASTGSARRLYEPPLDMFGADAVERQGNRI
ncbi:MAG: hypothetical protein HY869_05515 [Chloroflexi bacterium]|nr:hypothetical protein [Chloroflexota bacterium]